MKTQYNTLPSISQMKIMAKRLRLTSGQSITSHSHSLEKLSQTLGYKDWNTCLSAAKSEITNSPVQEGESVSGHYLGVSFTGNVQKLFAVIPRKTFRLYIQLDNPIDVVSSENFSNLRRQIHGTINQSGKTEEITSSGTPHLVLNLS